MERPIRFGLLLSTSEERALARLASFEGGMSKAAMVRNLIRREARDRGLWAPPDEINTSRQQEMGGKR
jgi:hypothetical protein